MSIFDPQLPHNELPLLTEHAVFHDAGLISLCQQIQQVLDRVNHIYDGLYCQTAASVLLPIEEAAVNTAPPGKMSNLDSLIQKVSLNLVPIEGSLYHSLRYHDALILGCRSLDSRRVCTATALLVSRYICDDETSIREHSGAEFMRGTKPYVIYRPPAGEGLILSRLANWELFLHEKISIHPLIRMAAGLFQFLAISPFPAANMRSAHVVSQLFLMNTAVMKAPILNLSVYLLKYLRTYEDLFIAVIQQNKWLEWLEFVLKAVLHQAQRLESRIVALDQLCNTVAQQVEGIALRGDKEMLVKVLMQKPYCASKHLVDAGVVQRHSAALYLKKLRDVGLLQDFKHGRDKLYVNSNLLKVIDSDRLEQSAIGNRTY